MPFNPGLWDGIPLGFSNGTLRFEWQQIRHHGGGRMFPPQNCMRKCCESQTSQTRAPFPAVSRLVEDADAPVKLCTESPTLTA